MYAIDIFWRLAFIFGNLTVYNLTVVAVSTAAYVYRALLEEAFLKQFTDYRDYMEHVRYRMVPGVF